MIVPDAVLGVELVAVFAVDYPPSFPRLDGGEVVVGELVDEAPYAQRLLDLRVPERLGVMVPWQIDNALALSLAKPF
jgi:hypothetical protein